MKASNDLDSALFTKEQLKSWEDSDGVNFAIALARVTGWLLHVDWWNPKHENEDESKMKSLRVYVGDDSKSIFDIRGKMSLNPFCNNIILPLAKNAGKGKGEVLTRFYSEEKLLTLPLRVKPNEERIKNAEIAIKKNLDFLSKIPLRKMPFVPAHLAGKFTFGRCAPFAEAMKDIMNKKAIAIIAIEYNKQFNLSRLGYAHSINLNSDNLAEDVWGIEKIENIIARFGISKYELDENEHIKVVQTLKRNSPDNYQAAYTEAAEIIRNYFM